MCYFSRSESKNLQEGKKKKGSECGKEAVECRTFPWKKGHLTYIWISLKISKYHNKKRHYVKNANKKDTRNKLVKTEHDIWPALAFAGSRHLLGTPRPAGLHGSAWLSPPLHDWLNPTWLPQTASPLCRQLLRVQPEPGSAEPGLFPLRLHLNTHAESPEHFRDIINSQCFSNTLLYSLKNNLPIKPFSGQHTSLFKRQVKNRNTVLFPFHKTENADPEHYIVSNCIIHVGSPGSLMLC